MGRTGKGEWEGEGAIWEKGKCRSLSSVHRVINKDIYNMFESKLFFIYALDNPSNASNTQTLFTLPSKLFIKCSQNKAIWPILETGLNLSCCVRHGIREEQQEITSQRKFLLSLFSTKVFFFNFLYLRDQFNWLLHLLFHIKLIEHNKIQTL